LRIFVTNLKLSYQTNDMDICALYPSKTQVYVTFLTWFDLAINTFRAWLDRMRFSPCWHEVLLVKIAFSVSRGRSFIITASWFFRFLRNLQIHECISKVGYRLLISHYDYLKIDISKRYLEDDCQVQVLFPIVVDKKSANIQIIIVINIKKKNILEHILFIR